MCKIAIIPNASKIEKFNDFAAFMADIMSDMRDGYGYAAQGLEGVFGYRTLSPRGFANAFEVPEFCESPGVPFGVKTPVIGGAMFHGRLSTNEVSIRNTHPIARNEWLLIHNGVVTNHGDRYDALTSNDSEHVLYNLITGGIEGVSENLTGYYAAGAFDPKGNLHVFRDSIASLYYAFSEKLDSPIFATTKDMIEDIGEYIGEELIAQKVKDDVYLLYSEGKLISTRYFKSRGYDKASAKLSSISLGRTLASDNEGPSDGFTASESIGYGDLDDSFTFHYGKMELSLDDFLSLDYYDQLDCVVRKDGVIVETWSERDTA